MILYILCSLFWRNKSKYKYYKTIYGIFRCKILNIIYKHNNVVYNIVNLHFWKNVLCCITLFSSFPTIFPTTAAIQWYYISCVLYFDDTKPNISIKTIYGIFRSKILNIIYKHNNAYNKLHIPVRTMYRRQNN